MYLAAIVVFFLLGCPATAEASTYRFQIRQTFSNAHSNLARAIGTGPAVVEGGLSVCRPLPTELPLLWRAQVAVPSGRTAFFFDQVPSSRIKNLRSDSPPTSLSLNQAKWALVLLQLPASKIQSPFGDLELENQGTTFALKRSHPKTSLYAESFDGKAIPGPNHGMKRVIAFSRWTEGALSGELELSLELLIDNSEDTVESTQCAPPPSHGLKPLVWSLNWDNESAMAGLSRQRKVLETGDATPSSQALEVAFMSAIGKGEYEGAADIAGKWIPQGTEHSARVVAEQAGRDRIPPAISERLVRTLFLAKRSDSKVITLLLAYFEDDSRTNAFRDVAILAAASLASGSKDSKMRQRVVSTLRKCASLRRGPGKDSLIHSCRAAESNLVERESQRP